MVGVAWTSVDDGIRGVGRYVDYYCIELSYIQNYKRVVMMHTVKR
jgi:hypothetical protein